MSALSRDEQYVPGIWPYLLPWHGIRLAQVGHMAYAMIALAFPLTVVFDVRIGAIVFAIGVILILNGKK